MSNKQTVVPEIHVVCGNANVLTPDLMLPILSSMADSLIDQLAKYEAAYAEKPLDDHSTHDDAMIARTKIILNAVSSVLHAAVNPRGGAAEDEHYEDLKVILSEIIDKLHTEHNINRLIDQLEGSEDENV